MHRAARGLSGLDIVVNNAGFAFQQPDIRNHSTAVFEQTFGTNVYAPFLITRAAVPLLPPDSSIIFTASALAARGNPINFDYATTKAMLVSFTRSLSQQLWSAGIRVNAVAPAATYTNFITSQGVGNEEFQARLVAFPGRRPAMPAEIAPVYVTLAEGRSSYTSGSV